VATAGRQLDLVSDRAHAPGTDPLIVRDAVSGDANALVPLLAALGYPADGATIAARMSDLRTADSTGRLLVAELGSLVVGFVTVHITPVLHRPTSVGRITGLAVLPDARGTGAGRALVEAAEAHCRESGLSRIEVTSGLAHTAAYQFYTHLGYENQGVRFAKTLTRA
jgi:GNAT superfamily N-acetyltransferase